jgi:quinol monooxygenase YgiN
MYVTMTGGKITPEQSAATEKFLAEFLPRFRRQPGVLAVYHYMMPDKGEDLTITIWTGPEAVKAYRESELIKEPMAFEKAHGMATNRSGYPLIYASSAEIK